MSGSTLLGIQRTLLDWHRFVEFDYALYIPGGSIVIEYIPSPEEIEKFLVEFGFLSKEKREQLADYTHYRTHRTHRRPAAWSERYTWGPLKEV